MEHPKLDIMDLVNFSDNGVGYIEWINFSDDGVGYMELKISLMKTGSANII